MMNTESNSTGSAEDDLHHSTSMATGQITLPVYVIAGVAVAVACVSGLLNGCVLASLSRVDSSTLKAKHFIRNTTLANMLLPIVSVIDLPLFTSALKMTNPKLSLCLEAVYYNTCTVFALVQVTCSIFLICDGIYVTAAPMLYHVIGYKTWIRRCTATAPWLLGFGIWCSLLLVTLASSPPVASADSICQALTDTCAVMSLGFVEIYLIATHCLAFIMYIGIFVGVKYQLAETQQYCDTKLNRETLLLVFSYFLINITTLSLYLPLPVYLSVVDWTSLSVDEAIKSEMVYRALSVLYLCNSIVDPMILAFRIRSIRDKLPFNFFKCVTRN